MDKHSTADRNACDARLESETVSTAEAGSEHVDARSGVLPSKTRTPRVANYQQALVSPLRYPGAKRQLIPFFVDMLAAQPHRIETFVEPFAGGASVSLHLAARGLVDRVVLGERDELLHAFWWTAAYDSEWLCDAVANVEISLARWDAFRQSPGTTRRDWALAALFLNRTSFSGILHHRAGPIGGRAQTSVNTIDVRFPRERLIGRLEAVAALADSGKLAAVYKGSYAQTVMWARKRCGDDGMFVYLDPPFFAKGEQLYRHSFTFRDHAVLARYLAETSLPWLLSYDHHTAVIDLYKTPYVALPHERARGRASVTSPKLRLIDLRYSAHSKRRGTEELIVTNLRVAPEGYLRTRR